MGGRQAVASAQVKELCWVEGRLAVGYPYSIISLVQNEKEKDVNEPLMETRLKKRTYLSTNMKMEQRTDTTYCERAVNFTFNFDKQCSITHTGTYTN